MLMDSLLKCGDGVKRVNRSSIPSYHIRGGPMKDHKRFRADMKNVLIMRVKTLKLVAESGRREPFWKQEAKGLGSHLDIQEGRPIGFHILFPEEKNFT